MDLTLFIVLSAVYLMVIHFGLAIKNEFNLWFMCGLFVLAGFIGWFTGGLDIAFIVAVVLSLMLW